MVIAVQPAGVVRAIAIVKVTLIVIQKHFLVITRGMMGMAAAGLASVKVAIAFITNAAPNPTTAGTAIATAPKKANPLAPRTAGR